MKPPDHSHI